MATLVYLSLFRMVPPYLAADCQLVPFFLDESAMLKVSCALPTQGHVSSEGPAAAMETDALLLQIRGYGTVCQLI